MSFEILLYNLPSILSFYYFVQGHANVNAQAYDGNTPLHLAVAAENKDLVRLLLSVNADVNITNYDSDGEAPLDLCSPTQEVRSSSRICLLIL